MPQFSSFRTFSRAAAIALLLCIGACNSGSKSSPSSAPTGFTVRPVDSGAVLTFDQTPGLDYWVFYAAAPSITVDNYNTFPQSRVVKSISSPFTAAGLTNGTTYSFILNSTQQGSPAGPATASISTVPVPAGTTWTARAPFTTANFYGVLFTLGVDIIVGSHGEIFTSPDSLIWTERASNVTTDLRAVAQNSTATQVVAVGTSGTILTSADAITWTASTSGTTVNLNGVASGAAILVAVGDGGTILSSADGLTWAQQTSGTTKRLNAVAFLNGTTFVAVGAGGTLLTSTDGVTWTAQTSGTTAELFGEAFGNAIFVAVGAGGTVISSSDAITWTVQTPTGKDLYAVAIGTQTVAVGAGGTIIYGSPASWAVAASGTTNNLRAVYYALGLIAVGDLGTITISN